MDWLAVLRAIPEDRRVVVHVPETPRYRRARAKLRYLVASSTFLGVQQDPEREDAVLLATWAPPGHGHGSGYYACFRLFFDSDIPIFAALYCFYDGTERSMSFKSHSAALTYARSHHFLPELP